jgi:hypothetical protein
MRSHKPLAFGFPKFRIAVQLFLDAISVLNGKLFLLKTGYYVESCDDIVAQVNRTIENTVY